MLKAPDDTRLSGEMTDQIPENDARDALEQSLKADSDFLRSEVNGAVVFTWHNPEFSGYRLQSYTVHAFFGDIWFASSSEDDSAPTTEAAIAAIRAANPTIP